MTARADGRSRHAVRLAWAMLAGLAIATAFEVGAQETARPSRGDAASPADETADQQLRRQSELRQVEEALAASGELRKRVEAEIAGLKGDAAKLNAALIETAQR